MLLYLHRPGCAPEAPGHCSASPRIGNPHGVWEPCQSHASHPKTRETGTFISLPAGHVAWAAKYMLRFPSPLGMRVAEKALTWFLLPPMQTHHLCHPGKHNPFIKAAKFGCDKRTRPLPERIAALRCAKAQADLCPLFPSRISFLRAGSSCSCSIPRESASCISSG